MANIEIYTTKTCPFCLRAKELLASKGVSFTEYSVDNNPDLRQAMTNRAGGKHTVPQIFIDNKHIGGCDELIESNRTGDLDRLLKNDGNGKGGPGPT
jgi:glutaredoxin 3